MIKKFILKFNDLQPTAKAAICFTVCNLFLKGINLLTMPIFTLMLSDYEYGTLSLFMSYEQFLLIFATWEISLGAYQKGIFKYKDDTELFTSSSQLFTNVITIVLFVILLLFKEVLYSFTGMDAEILTLLFFFLLMQPAYSSYVVKKQAECDYKPVIKVTVAYTLLNVFVPIVALVFFGRTAKIKFSAGLLTSLLFFLFFYLKNAKNYCELRRNLEKTKEQWKFIVSFQLPLVLHSLSYLVLGQADRVMIGEMVGKEQAGYYSIAYTLASVISIIQNSINQVLIPWCYRKMDAEEYDEIKKNTSYLLIGMGVIALCTILVAPEIMRIMFTKDYYEAVWSISPVTIGIYFVFLYSVFVNIETYFSKTAYIMYVSVACGILNIVLNFCLINVFGYIVCGYTTLISYIAFAVGHYHFMKKVCKEEIPDVRLFNLKKVVAISICVMAAGGMLTFLYPYWKIRYGLVCLIGILAVCKRRMISDLFKTILKRV